MKTTLTPKQRAVWQAIAKDKKHPWFSLAVEALSKEQRLKAARKFIKKLLKP
jgi:hypothetical protein